jgi:parallel beta-helix repeat protein
VNIQGVNNLNTTNAQGIFLTGASGNVRVLNNQVNNALREGIRLDNVSGTALIAGNTVSGTRTDTVTNNLESAIFVSNNTGFVDLTIRNNTVTDTLGNADGIEFNLCRFNGDMPITTGCAGGGSAIVRVQNNIISRTTRGDGIDFNLLSGSQTIAEISGNILTGIGDKGISFGSDGNALFAATIINNQITTDPTIATTDETRGISLNLGASANGASPLTVGGITAQGTLISGNTINNTEESGILLRTRSDAQLLATVSNNTVSNTNSKNDGDQAGIKIRAQNTSSQTVVVENNTVSNSGRSGINIRAANAATARATVRGNTVTNTNISGNANEAGILARSQDTARVCIRLENNSSLNPLSAADFRMRRQAGTAFLELFNLSSPIAVGAPSAPLQTFLTNAPQNNIGGNNKFFVTGNPVQVPTAGCTFP